MSFCRFETLLLFIAPFPPRPEYFVKFLLKLSILFYNFHNIFDLSFNFIFSVYTIESLVKCLMMSLSQFEDLINKLHMGFHLAMHID